MWVLIIYSVRIYRILACYYNLTRSSIKRKIVSKMALELPPRRSRETAEVTIQRKRSSLDVLMQMGFTKARA